LLLLTTPLSIFLYSYIHFSDILPKFLLPAVYTFLCIAMLVSYFVLRICACTLSCVLSGLLIGSEIDVCLMCSFQSLSCELNGPIFSPNVIHHDFLEGGAAFGCRLQYRGIAWCLVYSTIFPCSGTFYINSFLTE
jgi:hypothetical protein